MKNKLVQFIALAFAIVPAAAMQDMLPTFGGVKPPLVAAVAGFAALRLSLGASLGASLAAGLLVDALSGVSAFCAAVSMPTAVTGVYFLRRSLFELPKAVAGALASIGIAVLGEVWLAVNGSVAGIGAMVVRTTAALALSLPLGMALGALMHSAWHHAGLDEAEALP